MNPTLTISLNGSAELDSILSDERHNVRIEVDVNNRDVYLHFSTREALYELGHTLMRTALFGEGDELEFYPLIQNTGQSLVVNGARLTADSSRVFLFFPRSVEDAHRSKDADAP